MASDTCSTPCLPDDTKPMCDGCALAYWLPEEDESAARAPEMDPA